MSPDETNNRNVIAAIDNQTELVSIRNNSESGSALYQRANDKIRDIQLDTNNKQTGAFADFIKEYKIQNDNLSRRILILTFITAAIGGAALLIQIIGLTNSSPVSKVEITQVGFGK